MAMTEQESQAILDKGTAAAFEALQAAGHTEEAQAAYSQANAVLVAEHEARVSGEGIVVPAAAEEVTSLALTVLRERCVQEGATPDEVENLGIEDLVELFAELVVDAHEAGKARAAEEEAQRLADEAAKTAAADASKANAKTATK